MRLSLVIGILLLQLFSSSSAGATSAVEIVAKQSKGKTQTLYSLTGTRQQQAGKGGFPHCQFVHVLLKTPKHGPQPATATQISNPPSLALHSGHYFLAYFSPSYLPLQRLLLFPNHYFW
ncbi:MAG: hypothetical protein M3Q06_00030 [Bacteroidota bacterium]|nr:hypothetical protein [Bacteroidota bacterium]